MNQCLNPALISTTPLLTSEPRAHNRDQLCAKSDCYLGVHTDLCRLMNGQCHMQDCIVRSTLYLQHRTQHTTFLSIL